MYKNYFISVYIIGLMVMLSGCSGVQTFQSNLRAGDTAVVAAGWKHNFSRDNIQVTITPSTGPQLNYSPGDPAVRAVVNMYPDPVSSILISQATNQDLTPYAQTYALGTGFYTGGDKDWWQTTVFVDLPNNIPTGLTTILISNTAGDFVESTVNIVDGAGQPELFDVDQNGPMSQHQLASLERVEHFVVSFSSAVIPYAIQVNFRHDADSSAGGVGKAYVSNPRGDVKSIMWQDDGNNLQVILTPTQPQVLSSVLDFKFYVSGGIENLLADSITAVDINGSPITDVNVNISAGK